MKFRTTYTAKTDADRKRWATNNTEESMAQESDAKDADINVIMARYQQTGQIPQQMMSPLFGDFTEPLDYATAVSTIRAAEEAFLEVPAKIRNQFGNDPGQFIEFCSKEENREKLQEMGLVNPPKPPTIEEQTLNGIKELKPKEDNENGTRQERPRNDRHGSDQDRPSNKGR